MKDYPFIKCLNPCRILNKWTGEYVLIQCGQCEHCRLSKALALTTRCKLESSCHRFTYFVTLTFDKYNLPCAKLVLNYDKTNVNMPVVYYDVVRESDGVILGTVHFKDYVQKNNLVVKCKAGHNRIPILDPYICQKFVKRLRKCLNEKIRVYYCGEYGPVHFRPHFHLLLWFEEEETLSVIREALSKSWTFGRIDSSLASGRSSSYVSSYVNSSINLPRVLTLPGTKPFSHHSWYLGEQFLKSEIKELQKEEYSTINKRRYCYNGVNTDVILWRSLKSHIFPKLKGYASQSQHERVLSYQAFSIIRNWTQETCPIRQARFIADYVRYIDFYHENDEINDLLQLFRSHLNYYEKNPNSDIVLIRPFLADYDKFEQSVYRHILQSRYFLRTICNGDDSYHNVSKMLDWIQGYYDFIDSDNLKNQLDIESKIHKVKDADSSFFFHNILSVDKLKNSKLFKRHASECISRSRSFVKHKEQNDLNLYFNY